MIDITGRRFGRLTVLSRDSTDYIYPSTGKHASRWLCQCDCGNQIVVCIYQLTCHNTRSCGCLQRERSAEAHTKHGHRYERLHSVWSNMKNRCYNKNYKEYCSYGARGITVCEQWQSYEPFRGWALSHGYDPEAPRSMFTLDRIDVNGSYSPENCRFVNMYEQANNKTDNVFYTYNDKTLTISQWARELGMTYDHLYYRLRAKRMSFDDIIHESQ